MSENVELRKNEEKGQYEAWIGDEIVSLATYTDEDGVITYPHTETNPEFQGQGLAGKVVKFALDDALAQGKKIRPVCPYVRKYVREHAEYKESVASA